jgi:hypothetical protein
MSDDKKSTTPDPGVGWMGHLLAGRENLDPNAPPLLYVTRRPKPRRKGQLNDGKWAPGYGPDAKKNGAKKTP